MKNNDKLIEERFHKCERWLHGSSEEYDDWDYDGETLYVFLNGECIEKYSNKDLSEVINNF